MNNIPDEVKKEARTLAQKTLGGNFNKYKATAIYPYCGQDGEALYYRWRMDLLAPDDSLKSKEIRPFFFNGSQWKTGMPPIASDKKPLYRWPDVINKPDDVIYIVEGEKCADTLAAIGVLAVTNGGATDWNNLDLSSLNNRHIVAWPDFDAAGNKWLKESIKQLQNIVQSLQIIDVPALGLSDKGDCVDWLQKNPNANADDILALPRIQPKTTDELIPVESEERKNNAAEKIVKFVMERAELFHDENREVYATLHVTGETFRIGFRAFDDWLSASMMHEAHTVLRDQPKREALQSLEGIARHKGDEKPVALRCGKHEQSYFIDLCQPDNAKAIQIYAGGWQIVERPPVRFFRNNDAKPLPTPVSGGSIEPLWKVANVPQESRALILAWLIESFRPDTPFAVLELIGEEGTAKSTTQNALRNLLDPNKANLRSAPRNREDLLVSASINWCVSYENLSHMNGDMQDALCTISTGGGFASRKLYTNGEETTMSFKRPVILNGISAIITQQDLLGRAVSLELPRITHRTEAAETETLFAAHHAEIFGGLMDLFAATLAEIPSIHIPPDQRPRMADFCRLGMAMVKAQGGNPQTFFDRFNEMRRDGISRTIDASPVASAIIAFLELHPEGMTDTPTRILNRLNDYRPERCDAWPKTGKGLSDAMRRYSPALNQLGFDCRPRDDLSKRDGHKWTIEKKQCDKSIQTMFTTLTTFTDADKNASACEGGEHGEGDSRTFLESDNDWKGEAIL